MGVQGRREVIVAFHQFILFANKLLGKTLSFFQPGMVDLHHCFLDSNEKGGVIPEDQF